MKQLFAAWILAILCTCTVSFAVYAQAPETIWLSADTATYKTGEVVMVTVNAVSAKPIQGFTFQIRYDPACLKAVNAASPNPNMNGLLLPQSIGVVDASFASTTPQTANGILAQVRFQALTGCQTDVVLESAALAVRNSSGFAAPLPGIAISGKTIPLNIDKTVAPAQATQPLVGTPLPLGAEQPSGAGLSVGTIILLGGLALLVIVILGLFMLILRKPSAIK